MSFTRNTCYYHRSSLVYIYQTKPLDLYSFRNLLFHPLLGFIVFLSTITSNLITITFNFDSNKYLYLGDFCYFFKINPYLNLVIIGQAIISFISQIINYFNYYKKKTPEYMSVFDMMNGMVTPLSIGLKDVGFIRQISRISRISFKVIEFFNFINIIGTMNSGLH